MRELAYIIAHPIIFYGAAALIILAVTKNRILSWLAQICLLIAWGVFTAGLVLFMALAVHIPAGNYGAALLTLLAGSAIYLPWVFFGLPVLVKKLRKGPIKNQP